MDAAELQAAADKTKGRFYTWQTAGTLFDDLPAGRHVPMKPTGPPMELWNRWPVVLLLLRAVDRRMDASETKRNGINWRGSNNVAGTLRVPFADQRVRIATKGAPRHTECAYYIDE